VYLFYRKCYDVNRIIIINVKTWKKRSVILEGKKRQNIGVDLFIFYLEKCGNKKLWRITERKEKKKNTKSRSEDGVRKETWETKKRNIKWRNINIKIK
jgi:hypothetical protein